MNPNRNDEQPEYRNPYSGANASNRQPYQLSPEEIRVLKECNSESFYKRCLPISTFLGTSTFLGVKNGFLRSNAKYGATPKVVMSVIVGYFLGKFSYQAKCAEKLMQLPSSHLGELLRQKRSRNRQDTLDSAFGPGMSLTPFGNLSSTDMYSDLNPSNSLDIDTTRPENPGLDDYHRPSLDNPVFEDEEEMPPIQKHSTSYDELRKKNRDEYHQKRLGNYKDFSNRSGSVQTPQVVKDTTVEKEFDMESKAQTPRNKYGDVWG